MVNSPRRNTTPSPQGDGLDSPIAEELNRIAMLAVSSGTRLAKLQSETADSVVAEVLRRQSVLLAKADEPPLTQWSSLGQTYLQRNMEFTRAWWEVAARTQEAMLEAMQECLVQPAVQVSRADEAWRGNGGKEQAFTERRHQNEVIRFPDRRAA